MVIPVRPLHWTIPLFRAHVITVTFWDVKFYPFTAPGVDPVFAAVGGTLVSPSLSSKPFLIDGELITASRLWLPGLGKVAKLKYCDFFKMKMYGSLRNRRFWCWPGKADAGLNSCTWTKDSETGEPLICVAGTSREIKILNPITGESKRVSASAGSWPDHYDWLMSLLLDISRTRRCEIFMPESLARCNSQANPKHSPFKILLYRLYHLKY
jgi:hypothetical protein